MDQIFEKYSATELDNILHALIKYEQGDGFSADEIQTSIWLDGKIAPPIEDAIRAIVDYSEELIAITLVGKTSKKYKPGAELYKFLNSGGFKGIFEKQLTNENRSTQERSLAQQANLASINAAASARRSADASQVSANAADRSAHLAKQALVVSIIAALLSIVTFLKSFFG